jgi:hypothetical protein
MQVERAASDFGWVWASGERVSNTSVTYPLEEDNRWKRRLKLHDLAAKVVRKDSGAKGGAGGLSGSWWGKSLPSR